MVVGLLFQLTLFSTILDEEHMAKLVVVLVATNADEMFQKPGPGVPQGELRHFRMAKNR